jgi:hypothetical protein
MLKPISDGVFLLALIAMSSLWTLALTGRLALPVNPQQQSAEAHSAKESPQESLQTVDQLSEQETEKRPEDAIRKALNTPPPALKPFVGKKVKLRSKKHSRVKSRGRAATGE